MVTARITKENLRENDIIARLGGDEFGVLLHGASVETAMIVAEKLRRTMEDSELCLINDGCFNVSISIGVVMVDGALDSQRLLALADAALYAAKEKGRNRTVLLDSDKDTTSRYAEITHLISRIKTAIKEDSFVLYYQPVTEVVSRAVVHYEGLIRLKQDDGQLMLPSEFIPEAERFGLMPQIDQWVVETSLDVLRRHPALSLFINISGVSLGEESLLVNIEEMIRCSDIDASRLGFEITETAAVKEISLARYWIGKLRSLGCRFALDDFGVGFSSFSYLHAIPVDYLKIDGTFIQNLENDPTHRSILTAMSTVARSLGIRTIAEHVENENTLAILAELGIDCAQGYFLGLPAVTI